MNLFVEEIQEIEENTTLTYSEPIVVASFESRDLEELQKLDEILAEVHQMKEEMEEMKQWRQGQQMKSSNN